MTGVPPRPITVSVVGSTGSIGRQALEVVRSEPERYRVVGLAASTSVGALAEQAAEFRPERLAVASEEAAAELRPRLPAGTELWSGAGALAAVARAADVVVNGVVGFAGLEVTLAALDAGRRLALANKESLVAGGPVVASARARSGAEIIPVDSEHCALHQCLRATGDVAEVARLVLTASGGPFRGHTREELEAVTVDDALAHPTWAMGPKITVDSSTLMNKGLEVIEAHELFGVGYDQIEVVIHPQSIVHSMVELIDGTTIAQLSLPDMRLPLAYALAWPGRSPVARGALPWREPLRLDFEAPDRTAFRCLDLAYDAGRAGGSVPAWLNAANEVSVAAFLEGKLAWVAIPDVIEAVLAVHHGGPPQSADDVIEADRLARARARHEVERRTERRVQQP